MRDHDCECSILPEPFAPHPVSNKSAASFRCDAARSWHMKGAPRAPFGFKSLRSVCESPARFVCDKLGRAIYEDESLVLGNYHGHFGDHAEGI